MVNPFKKTKLKIKTPKTFEKTEAKPNIITTFRHFCPESPMRGTSRTIMSLCPIHKERNPSFAMYRDTNTYFCFSCNATGDAYTLIMELGNMDFKGARDYARRNGLYG